MTSTYSIPSAANCRLAWPKRLVRHRLVDWLDRLTDCRIDFTDPWGAVSCGSHAAGRLRTAWTVQREGFFSQLAARGDLGLAESYIRGDWHAADLTTLLRILYRHQQRSPLAATFTASLTKLFHSFLQRIDSNTHTGSRRHIAAHYDLSNEFFELFLDPTLMYSSAYYADESYTLHEASIAKLEQICHKLDLQTGDQVLEIGTGWGGFALHAAKHYDVHLTSTTISSAQHDKARQRFQAAKIDDRVTLLDADYRDLSGQYDKLVSIEMVEAVGERYLETYFRKCAELLAPHGRFVVQAIVMPDSRYDRYRKQVDFIQKYVFPGGFLPSVPALRQAAERTGELELRNVEDLSPHYARTLAEWRSRFFSRLADVRSLGFDDNFIRMWEYYLCYCEAAFREQAVRVVQIAWDKSAP